MPSIASSPTLTLRQPSEKERVALHTGEWTHWGGPLKIETFLARAKVLKNTQLAKSGFKAWYILVDTAVRPEEQVILASCEVTGRPALICTPSEGAEAPVIEDTRLLGVSAVLTPAEHRRKGYAGRMIRDLANLWKIQAETPVQGRPFSVLWSDVGKEFYNVHGWQPKVSTDLTMRPSASASSHMYPSCVSLTADDVISLSQADITRLRAAVANATKCSEKKTVALVPNAEMLLWHFDREDFMTRALFNQTPPSARGVMIQTNEPEDRRAWCVWARMWYGEDPSSPVENKLYILRISLPDADASKSHSDLVKETAALLRKAQKEATVWNLETVELWDPEPVVVEAAQLLDEKARINVRDSSIASLQWLDGSTEDFNWLAKEKFAWF